MNISRTSYKTSQFYSNGQSNNNKTTTNQISFKGGFLGIPPEQVQIAYFGLGTDVLLCFGPLILKSIKKLFRHPN